TCKQGSGMDDRQQKVLARLDDQISWYDTHSSKNQRYYKCVKVISMSAAGFVPVLAAFGFQAAVAGVFGFFSLICEGLQQLNQYHGNWISYRSTCEALKHEKHLYEAGAGHYRNVDDPISLLAEQVESLVSV